MERSFERLFEVLADGYVRMAITDFELALRLGIHDWEREAPQRILINIEMFARDVRKGPENGLESVVDYDYIRRVLVEWPKRPQVDLIETLLEELVELCFRHPRVIACRVSIVKPDIFPEATSAGVEVFRVRR
jgi:7,8-dihydroneopterin aldolase/epimerase/oxygenase